MSADLPTVARKHLYMSDVTQFSATFACMALDYARTRGDRRRSTNGGKPRKVNVMAETPARHDAAVRAEMERAIARRLARKA
jgi:hypothetical protein